MSVVVEASAVVELLRWSATGRRVHARLVGHDLLAPHLLVTEVLSAFRGLELGGYLTPERGLGAVADLLDLPVTLVEVDRLSPQVWALRHNLTAYDATYVALARSLGSPLVTTDDRIAAALGRPEDVIVV